MSVATYIKQLQAEADEKNMLVDWEACKLVPKPMAGMSPHQRDFYVREVERQEHYKDLRAESDNDAGSPEQGWA